MGVCREVVGEEGGEKKIAFLKFLLDIIEFQSLKIL